MKTYNPIYRKFVDDRNRTTPNQMAAVLDMNDNRVVATKWINDVVATAGANDIVTLGAGDCFASTTTVGIIQGKTLEESMKWGSINSMSVVQEIGAQRGLLTKDKIEAFLKTAPEGWNAQAL